MIGLLFDPSTLTGEKRAWWDKWSRRAAKATQAVVNDLAAGRPPSFRQPIWRDLKDWLLVNVFHGKCAYCECACTAGFYGDAEHYRPKGKVTVNGADVQVAGKAHAGYPWLAYSWTNLIPSCQRCNSGGKGTEFRVGSKYSPDPNLSWEALNKVEAPLLLHPYCDNPRRALVFGELGTVSARDGDPRGEYTIAVCGLRRSELQTARQKAQENAWRQYRDLIANGLVQAFESWVITQEYAAAMIDYVLLMYDKNRPRFGY